MRYNELVHGVYKSTVISGAPFYMGVPQMGVPQKRGSIYGGYPIAGWFIRKYPKRTWMRTGGTSCFKETPIPRIASICIPKTLKMWIPTETNIYIWIDLTRMIQECIPLYGGFLSHRGTPKSSISMGFSLINHPFWGPPFYGNRPMADEPTSWSLHSFRHGCGDHLGHIPKVIPCSQ